MKKKKGKRWSGRVPAKEGGPVRLCARPCYSLFLYFLVVVVVVVFLYGRFLFLKAFDHGPSRRVREKREEEEEGDKKARVILALECLSISGDKTQKRTKRTKKIDRSISSSSSSSSSFQHNTLKHGAANMYKCMCVYIYMMMVEGKGGRKQIPGPTGRPYYAPYEIYHKNIR